MPTVVPHRVLVAPSGFKESLAADQVADAIAAGVRRSLPGAVVDTVPMVDGGEGSASALARATGGELVPMTVTGPVGEPVAAGFAVLGGAAAGTAVVEMAAAAGLRLVPRDLRDPGATTTYGVGELLQAALETGCRRIIVGCGDSGTSDGGAGALQALGARVLDAAGQPVGRGGAALASVDRVDLSGLDARWSEVEVLVACNPHNVLCGARGVARVFGPQKGATPEQVEQLAAALDRWAGVLERDCASRLGGLDLRNGAGTGASGGLGAGLAAGLGAALRPRFEVFLGGALAGGAGDVLEPLLAAADLVITAEGAVDFQTPKGKVPAEIARRAKAHGKPVLALAGSIGAGAVAVHDVGIDAVAGIIPVPMGMDQAVADAAALLADATERALRLMLLGAAMAGSTGATLQWARG